MKIIVLILVAIFTLGGSAAAEVTTVGRVDLGRYVGLWYEMARIPNTFQNQCLSNTTAHYRLLSDGQIEVKNTCTEAGEKMSSATGVAKVVDPVSNAKLKVSFVQLLGVHLFWGDYWIIGLDPEYRWAVVGHPDRKYGWILSRTSKLTPEQMVKIKACLSESGYEEGMFAPRL